MVPFYCNRGQFSRRLAESVTICLIVSAVKILASYFLAVGDKNTFFRGGGGANKILYKYFFTCPNMTDFPTKISTHFSKFWWNSRSFFRGERNVSQKKMSNKCRICPDSPRWGGDGASPPYMYLEEWEWKGLKLFLPSGGRYYEQIFLYWFVCFKGEL